jgi:hypothetical protein
VNGHTKLIGLWRIIAPHLYLTIESAVVELDKDAILYKPTSTFGTFISGLEATTNEKSINTATPTRMATGYPKLVRFLARGSFEEVSPLFVDCFCANDGAQPAPRTRKTFKTPCCSSHLHRQCLAKHLPLNGWCPSCGAQVYTADGNPNMAQIVREIFDNLKAADPMTRATHDLMAASERMREASKSMIDASRSMVKAAEAMEKAAMGVGKESEETEVRIKQERLTE